MSKQSSVDPDATTAAMRAQWDHTAQGWHESGAIIRPWLHQATQAMLGMAGIKPGSHVLDVAAGAGDQTMDIAKLIGPGGYVLATDLSAEILRFAAKQAATAGYCNVETRVSDGQQLQIEDSRFDAVVCRLGLMFFGEPLQGLREMARVLKPGGGICTMVFGSPQANP
ncbi:MAG: class I SAM-dependent methyltransferase, partial [Bradyrhizobium sp.]